MAIQVLMPQLGESVVEGTLTKWLKVPGDKVEEYEALVEVNTDKVDTEVPSPGTGVLLEVLVPEGTLVQAGTLLALIGEPGEKTVDIDEQSSKVEADARKAISKAAVKPHALADESASKQAQSLSPGRDHELGFISPVVARMANEHAIDLYQVTGTGQSGRITKKDIELFIAQKQAAGKPGWMPVLSPGSSIASSAPGSETSVADLATAAPGKIGETGELLPLSPLRKQIAEHMLRSVQTSPHVTTIMEVDLGRVSAHRQANKEAFARDNANLTFTAYFVAAAVAALKAFPLVNSSWSDSGIRLHQEINIGVATSLGEAGLIVPVIKHCDSLSLLGIARAVNDLANRARARQLIPDEVHGGTFTITNHGISGSLFATPIINQPQCAILGVGAIQKRPVVISDETLGDVIAIRTMVYLGLTFDHRILDGASADQFLSKVVEILRDWT